MHNGQGEQKTIWLHVGEQIRAIRGEKKVGLRELARRADLTPGFVSDLELNRRMASTEVLTAIAKALGVSPKDLIRTSARQRIAKLEGQIAELRREAR